MILNRNDQTLAIRALRGAAPYIRLYKGKTFVVKQLLRAVMREHQVFELERQCRRKSRPLAEGIA